MAQHSTFPVHDVRNWKVLIVDDVSDNLTVLEYTLRHHGATTYRAYNGQEGLALVEQVSPNLILLDIAMPVMDGWQMLNRLRAEQRYATIPVIAVTAHAMEGDRAQALGAGFDGYISKPFNIITLLQDIQTCFP